MNTMVLSYYPKQVAENMINPYGKLPQNCYQIGQRFDSFMSFIGDDAEDFDLNFLIDRHAKVIHLGLYNCYSN